MTRALIGLLITLALGLFVVPLASDAQQVGKIPRAGVLTTVIAPTTELFHELLRQGLRELGSVEGQTIALEYRSAEGQYTRLPALATELVGLPSASRIGVLWHPEFPPNVESLPELQRAAQALRVELHLVAYRGAEEFEGAVTAIRRDGAEALFVMPHPTTLGHAAQLAALAATHRLPAIAPYRHFGEAGGLLAYGGMFSDMYQRAPIFVDKILKGTHPSELPVERPLRFDFVINLKTKDIRAHAPPVHSSPGNRGDPVSLLARCYRHEDGILTPCATRLCLNTYGTKENHHYRRPSRTHL